MVLINKFFVSVRFSFSIKRNGSFFMWLLFNSFLLSFLVDPM